MYTVSGKKRVYVFRVRVRVRVTVKNPTVSGETVGDGRTQTPETPSRCLLWEPTPVKEAAKCS